MSSVGGAASGNAINPSASDEDFRDAYYEAIGVAPFTLAVCSGCGSIENLIWRRDAVTSWLLFVSCVSCDKCWAICRDCSKIKNRFTDRKGILKHSNLFHQSEHQATINSDLSFDVSVQTETSEFTMDVNFYQEMGEDEDSFSFKEDINFDSLDCLNDRSKRYFECDVYGHGMNSLVAKSQSRCDFSDVNHYHDYEISYHMDVARLISYLPIPLVELLSSIISQTVHIGKQRSIANQTWSAETVGSPTKKNRKGISASSPSHSSVKIFSTLPCNVSIMRRLYLDNKFGIIRNLPRPNVTLVEGHGYVSLKECLADLLAHGVELDAITSSSISSSVVRNMSESNKARSIYENARNLHGAMIALVLVLYFIEWSDDFEPMNSSKSNRGSTWAKTITMCPTPDCIHKLTHTYPIAVGRKNVSHECVERRLAAEMELLRGKEGTLFYSKRHGGMVRVYLELFASLQDQPERRSANYIMLGGGKYSAQWGLAADFASFALGVPSCTECSRRLFAVKSSVHSLHFSCNNCVNWDTCASSGLLDFSPPPNYPISELVQPNKKLRPLRITYDSLREAVEKSHEKIVSGSWTADNANAYLWVHGINIEARKEILEAATNERSFNALFNEQDSRREEFDAICRLKEQDPNLYKRWEFPALWSRGTQLSQHVDVIMHLVFLGVVRATIKRIEDWMKSKGKFEGFVKYVRGKLESVQSLGLGWCKALPYTTGNFGGWVSENYLALARLLPWFYSSVPLINDVPPPYVEPPGPPKNWTVKQNKYWLSSRNLPSSGLAKVLKARVTSYMNQDGGPPPIANVATGTAADVTEVARSLWCMVCNVMVKEVSDYEIETVRHQIKCFLSVFDVLDNHIPKKKVKKKIANVPPPPTWVTSYNYVCLLNLPDIMKEYGPLPNLWEGGGQGEKVLTKLKPLHNGYRSGWQKHLLSNALDAMALDRVIKSNSAAMEGMEATTTSCLTETGVGSWDNKSDYKRYKSKAAIRNAFRKGQPISAILLSDSCDTFWVCISNTKEMIPIQVNTDFPDQICLGLQFFPMTIPPSTTLGRDRACSDVIMGYCILLPLIDDGAMASSLQGSPANHLTRLFAVIDSKWQSLHAVNNNRIFQRPLFP